MFIIFCVKSPQIRNILCSTDYSPSQISSGQFLTGLLLSLLLWASFCSCLELLEEGRWTVKTSESRNMFTVKNRYFQFLIQTFWNTNSRLASCFIITFPVPAFLSDNFKVVMLWFISCAIVQLLLSQTIWCWLFLALEMQTNLLILFLHFTVTLQ